MKVLKTITLSLAALASFSLQAQDAALFTVSPGTRVCLGQSIQVNDMSTGGAGAVSYTFGDGTPSSLPNPTHTYATANTFTITQTLPISGTVTDPETGFPVGYVRYKLPVTVVPNTALSANYTVCGSGRVNINIVDTRFDAYDVDFGDGSTSTDIPRDPSGTTQSVHIYSTFVPHTVTIKGKFTAGNSCPAADLIISVTPVATVPKPDVIFIENTTEDQSNGVLTVQVINNTSYNYSWDFKRNGYGYTNNLGTISSASGTHNLALNKVNTNPYDPSSQSALYNSYTLNTKQNSYCVRFATTTTCGREALSDEICSITKFNATAGDLVNNLDWEAYAGPNASAVDVLRNNVVLTSLGAAANNHNDNSVVCGTLYEYQVKEFLTTTSSLGPQYSLSAKKQVTATSLTPRPELTNLFSTVDYSNITVTFDAPGGGFTAQSYQLLESVNGGSFNEVASNAGTPNSFTVSNRNTTTDLYTYKVNYKDLCNLSPANITTTTRPIRVNLGLSEDGTVAINWTTYEGSTPVNDYTIEVWDEHGNVIKSIPGGSGTSTTDLLANNAGRLFYVAIGDNGTTSAPVELVLTPAVFVPDAFSPNGDSHNDYLELKGRFIKDFSISIFNRWGEPVFHSTDFNKHWDGRVNGSDAGVGTYAYTLEVTGQKGEVIKQKGTISLVR